MHVTYQYDKNLSYVDMSNNNPSTAPNSIMTLIDKRITDLRREEVSIRGICVQLSQFLKANAITPVNDDMIEYLRLFLNEERQKQVANCNNADIIRGIEQMIEEYTQEMNLYSKSAAKRNDRSDSDQFNHAQSIEDMFDLVQELYALPINGRSIKEQMTKLREGQTRTVFKDEINVDLPTVRCSMNMSHLRTLANGRRR
jgi:hypothetical protein